MALRGPNLPSPDELRALGDRDPALESAADRLPAFPGFPRPRDRRLTHFQALARSIVYQQLAGRAAATIYRRACALTSGPGLPRPEDFLALPNEVLRGTGLSRPKIAAVRDLAARLGDGRLTLASIGRLSDHRIVERLTAVRGIGVWSAQMFLLFRLGRLDVMPATDLGVREGIRVLDGLPERPPPADVLARSETWRPLRSVASWVLWRLVEAGR
jgi:DNA-3-methyladenine glycosylase II